MAVSYGLISSWSPIGESPLWVVNWASSSWLNYGSPSKIICCCRRKGIKRPQEGRIANRTSETFKVHHQHHDCRRQSLVFQLPVGWVGFPLHFWEAKFNQARKCWKEYELWEPISILEFKGKWRKRRTREEKKMLIVYVANFKGLWDKCGTGYSCELQVHGHADVCSQSLQVLVVEGETSYVWRKPLGFIGQRFNIV